MAARRHVWLTIGVAALALLGGARRAAAFGLDGHFVIEAAAYKRLLALARVPETDVSGRELLGALIVDGLLRAPPCFDGVRAGGACDAEARREQPLAFWPTLGAGAADIIVDRQLSARGQCQHFMAETDDGFSPIDPRFGVPAGLVTTAYTRCVAILGAAYDGLLRDPALARTRLVGTYALIHAIEDSFSAAHVARDDQGRIVHLLSWTLIDWPGYLARGTLSFPAAIHHAITDHRDTEYLRVDGTTGDGRRCAELHNPYAVPEACLTPRARAAADAVEDFLVLTYRVRARAAAAGRSASLSSPDDLALWNAFVEKHLPSVAVPAPPAPLQGAQIGNRRPDTFIGVQATIASDGGGAGAWGGRLFFGPAVPFALALTGGAGWSRGDGGDRLVAAAALGLYLPLVRRFAVGVSPAGVAIACDTHFHDCNATLFATLGEVLVPLPHATWLGVQGPRWSWSERDVRGPVIGLAVGWSHEQTPDRAPAALAAWDPPAAGEVAAYRAAEISWLLFLGTTAGSTADNRWTSGGVEIRRERDRWDRRAGWAPTLSLSAAAGTTDGVGGGTAALAPAIRFYLAPDRLWLGAAPAAFRVGVGQGQSTRTLRADVAGFAAIGVIVGRLELAIASPPLSYVSRDRWHALPISVRLGLLFH